MIKRCSLNLDIDQGYTYYKFRSCTNQDIAFQGNVDNINECKQLCQRDHKCVSFQWWGASNLHPENGLNYCQISYSCTYDNSKLAIATNPSDLYVKGNFKSFCS